MGLDKDISKDFERICHEDRLFPVEEQARQLARQLYSEIADLPIISPHGHTEASWFSENKNFENVSQTFVTADHYLLRMLYSQGWDLREFGVVAQGQTSVDDRQIWRNFAKCFYLFRGTPSWLWLNYVFHEVFGLQELLSEKNADKYYEQIQAKLQSSEFTPRRLLEKFRIEVLATTDNASDSLQAHAEVKHLETRIIPTFRPDRATNPEHPDFHGEIAALREITKNDIGSFASYLTALKERRQAFKNCGATAADHGHPDPFTVELTQKKADELLQKALSGQITAEEARAFRGHMLLEMAQMSLDDGLVMQIHSGVHRNHNAKLYEALGPDKGADVPIAAEFVQNLKPFLDRFGNEKSLSVILFTLDESTYSRELAPLAGHYPALKLGPAWWFHDSPEGMIRFREQAMETAGFYNTVGFIDDTRAFFSIPARHDVARRIDARIMAKWLGEHRITYSEAVATLKELTYEIPKRSFKL